MRKPTKAYADRLVSAYAILNDTHCTTCGIVRADLQPGHFFRRVRQSVRWDLRNIACQCPSCNSKHNDNPLPLQRVILSRLGADGLQELERQSNTPLRQPDMDGICAHLRQQVEGLPRFAWLSGKMQRSVVEGRFTNRALVSAIHGGG
jgi:hypothetical protein